MCGGQAEDPRELWFPSNLSAGRRRPVSQRQGRQAQRHPSYSLSEQFRPQWIGRGPAHTGGPPALLSWQFECASHPETPSQTHPGCLARWAPSQVIHRPPPQSGPCTSGKGLRVLPCTLPPCKQSPPPSSQGTGLSGLGQALHPPPVGCTHFPRSLCADRALHVGQAACHGPGRAVCASSRHQPLCMVCEHDGGFVITVLSVRTCAQGPRLGAQRK